MKKKVWLFILVVIFIYPGSLYAHGVVYEIKNDKAVIIKVGYDDGEPMIYAKVKIFPPADRKTEYQNGRTDKNGCFSFLPDQSGEWKITVSDGMGHGVNRTIKVEEAMEIENISVGLPRWYKLIVGISVLWGLGGLVFFLMARKEAATSTRPDVQRT